VANDINPDGRAISGKLLADSYGRDYTTTGVTITATASSHAAKANS
jgi:hypothetical protein